MTPEEQAQATAALKAIGDAIKLIADGFFDAAKGPLRNAIDKLDARHETR